MPSQSIEPQIHQAHLTATRRAFLRRALFGSGLLGLRSIFSGLPPLAIADPQRYVAAMQNKATAQPLAPQYLILSTSDAGEPLNCNVPGMYTTTAFTHPTAPAMAPAPLNLGGQTFTAAGCWATLAASDLSRLNFFHMATGNFQHGGLGEVHRINGRVPGGEMLVSALAKNLQPLLNTIQPQPMVISGPGSDLISYGGASQAVFSPTFVRDLLTTPAALKSLNAAQALRDRDLDALNQALKARLNPNNQALIDAYATTQQQARMIPQALLSQLSQIADDSVASQIATAVLLCQLKLTPAVVVHLPFGGDNHFDTNPHDGPGALPAEGAQHIASTKTITTLTQNLQTQGLADHVTFATLSTFGRSNTPNLTGRAHNGQHACSLMLGANVRPGVTGGATLVGNNPVAMAIDPTSGAGQASGDLSGSETLASFGATLAQVLGLSTEVQQAILPDSQPISSVIMGPT